MTEDQRKANFEAMVKLHKATLAKLGVKDTYQYVDGAAKYPYVDEGSATDISSKTIYFGSAHTGHPNEYHRNYVAVHEALHGLHNVYHLEPYSHREYLSNVFFSGHDPEFQQEEVTLVKDSLGLGISRYNDGLNASWFVEHLTKDGEVVYTHVEPAKGQR